ncbi:hypothetical protein Q0Z83_045100 [Actinoplanes sichuanensis]|uniref:DUF6602 domain-containing protein n=1 Tax=Actinoplanes sichuanensis TaxID=512349 RepID=A0ABW4ARA4_9ACTN|nr:DUF6602 domain-containing protein [Actinoplanes sichuanensis]BEL06319.1 hypothetical protein Q0Z83_045100 [Actinoplanes sichuanensis]
MAYLEDVLASRDLRFEAALAEARALFHHGEAGALFEDLVLKIIHEMLPGTYTARSVLLAGTDETRKQLDVGVFPESIPPLIRQLNIDALTAVGEIKTRLSTKDSITTISDKLAAEASSRGRLRAVPFFVLVGKLEHSTAWLCDLVAALHLNAAAQVWPAVFSFDRDNATSVLRLTRDSALRAETAEGEILEGLVTIDRSSLSPSAVLYLWLWAAIYADEPVHSMDFRFMREAVRELTGEGLAVRYRQDGSANSRDIPAVRLLLPEDQPISPAAAQVIPRDARALPNHRFLVDEEPAPAAPDGRRVMLISLGPWTDEEDTWDESKWGGDAQETRTGYGYREGMSDAELLNAARLFWKWNPRSRVWTGVDYAVVAHAGRTRAVLRIDKSIGPFWGRWGFQGRVAKDSALNSELVDREVPRRQNPITSITL